MMRWDQDDTPLVGDLKEVKKFAFLPTKLDNGQFVWLGWYKIFYMYRKNDIFPDNIFQPYVWVKWKQY